MKFCTHCGTEIMDAAVLCPKCGSAVNLSETGVTQASTPVLTPSRKYCSHCGEAVLNDAVVCPKCGCSLSTTMATSGSGLQTAAKVFMIISCVLYAMLGILVLFSGGVFVYLIPLLWAIPMTLHYFKATKSGKPVGTGFKVCTLLFVSLVAGILMLCDNRR